jgi:hypothetical protein
MHSIVLMTFLNFPELASDDALPRAVAVQAGRGVIKREKA